MQEIMNKDESHLKTLAIFHYVLAAAAAFFSSMFLMHFIMGLAMVSGAFGGHGKDAPPAAMGVFFMGIGGVAVLLGWSFAGCLIMAGRSLRQHKRYTFCLIVAALACALCNPLGTVLGVFTIVVLLRPSVKALFDEPTAAQEVS